MQIINLLLIKSQKKEAFQRICYTVSKFLSARGNSMNALQQAWDNYVNAIRNFSDQHDQLWQPWLDSSETNSERLQLNAYKKILKDQNLSTQFQRETQESEINFFSALTKTLTNQVKRKYQTLIEEAKEDRISLGKEKFLKQLNHSVSANQVPKWLNNSYLLFLLKEKSSELEDAVHALLELPNEIETHWENFVSEQITVDCSLTDLVVLDNTKYQWLESISNQNKPYKTRFNQYLKNICYKKFQGQSLDSPFAGNSNGEDSKTLIDTIPYPDERKAIHDSAKSVRRFKLLLKQSACIPKEKYTHGYFLTQVLNLNNQIAIKWIGQTFSETTMRNNLLNLYIWSESLFPCFIEHVPHPYIQEQAPTLLHKHNLTADKQWQELLVQWRTQYQDPDTPFVQELKRIDPDLKVWDASTEYLRLLAKFRWRELLYEGYTLNQQGKNPIGWEQWQRNMQNPPAIRQSLAAVETKQALIPLLIELRELVIKAGLQKHLPKCFAQEKFGDQEIHQDFIDQLLKQQFDIHLLPFLPPLEGVHNQEPAFDLSILKEQQKNQILQHKNDGLRLDMAWHLYFSFLTQDLHEQKRTEPIHLEEFAGDMAISFQDSRDHFHLEEIQFTQEGMTP